MADLITRPVNSWYGGKFTLAPWIISHFPPHDNYIEPFGGMASVLLRKVPSLHEIYNDLNQYAVNMFRVLQDTKLADQLIRKFHFTPYAREELALAIKEIDNEDPLIKAWAFIVRSIFTISKNEKNVTIQKFDTRVDHKNLKKSYCARAWANYPNHLRPIIERLKDVIIESEDAIKLIKKYGKNRAKETLVYCDPPYLTSVKKSQETYRHEMTENDHIDLADAIKSTNMMFVISGYPSELYDRLYTGWETITKEVNTNFQFSATEKLWISPNVVKQISLF